MKTPKLIDIVGDKERMATMKYAVAGILYYFVEIDGISYRFPIDMNDKDDVGTTTFDVSIRAITLMRYIRKAIANDEFLVVQ